MDTSARNTVATIKSWDSSETQSFTVIAIVRKVQQRLARNGSTFLTVELGDATGKFHFNCFANTPTHEAFSEAKEGDVVEVKGSTEYYQGKFSPRVQQAVWISEEEVESQHLYSLLVESATEPADEMWQELQGIIEKIKDPALQETVKIALGDVESVFKTIPAAISMHHAYRYGLLEHTLHVCRNAIALLPLYTEVDADLALAGAIVHDFGKTIEYIEGNVTRKSRTGMLQGHVVLGYRIVRRAAMKAKLDSDLLERLEHIVLSHQGELEWGAAVMAATPEAVFVSMIDNLDAKMGMVQRALKNAADDSEFSEFLPGLKSSVLLTPPGIPSKQETQED